MLEFETDVLNLDVDRADMEGVDPYNLEGLDLNDHLSMSAEMKVVDAERLEGSLLGCTLESVTLEVPRTWWDRLFSWPWKPWIDWERRYTFNAKVTPHMDGVGSQWQRVSCDVEPVGPIAVQTWDGKLHGPAGYATPEPPPEGEDG